jgi:DNA-binding PadR family transcriptional regulator
MPTLTAHMRATLIQTRRGPLRRPHPPGAGAPPWPAAATTLHALVRQELVTVAEVRNRHGWPVTMWTITDAGRAALEPRERFRHQPDVYLTSAVPDTVTDGHGEFTTNPRHALCREPVPVIDADTLNDAWTQLAAARRHAAQDRRAQARRLANNLRAAA